MGYDFARHGHLGGYIRSSPSAPTGDPGTYTPALWDWLAATFAARTVLDVGCGEGHAVHHFRGRGLVAFGVDGCPAVLDSHAYGTALARYLAVHDFTRGPWSPPFRGRGVDLVYSCEFVEHVEERYAENFLRAFDLARKAVAMTHAFPGQGGYHHVNEQPAVYWINRLQARGLVLDVPLTDESRGLAPGTHWSRSGLVFVRPGWRDVTDDG